MYVKEQWIISLFLWLLLNEAPLYRVYEVRANAVGFVLAEHTNHPDVRAVACIGLTDGLAVREKDGKDAVGIPFLRRK